MKDKLKKVLLAFFLFLFSFKCIFFYLKAQKKKKEMQTEMTVLVQK